MEKEELTSADYLGTLLAKLFHGEGLTFFFFVSFFLGHRVLTILGSGLGGQDNDSMVFVGRKECVIVQWTATNITCRLPVLPPGLYKVDVQVGNNGYPQTRYSDCERHFRSE